MLILGSSLRNTPVMSLQTGARLAVTENPLIDPATLKIVAYEVSGPLLTEHPSLLRTADIREFGSIGMIIDSTDEIIGLDDVIKIKELHKLQFSLVGLTVYDDTKRKLGKVEDYTLETQSFVVQQLNVKRGFIKGLTETGLLISRTQIIEINNTSVIVKSSKIKVEPVMEPTRRDFVNPFRSQPSPEAEA